MIKFEQKVLNLFMTLLICYFVLNAAKNVILF